MNQIVIGKPVKGKSFARKIILSNELITEYIVKNHLNNNNWLKMHGKPMVRKGHPWYSRAKALKDVKHYEVILIEPEDIDFREFLNGTIFRRK